MTPSTPPASSSTTNSELSAEPQCGTFSHSNGGPSGDATHASQPAQIMLERLGSVGLDLLAWCDVAQIARSFSERGLDSGLKTFDRSSTLGLVVANTRALWPHFLAHVQELGRTPDQLAPDPLDNYVEQAITWALGAFAAAGHRSEIHYAHHLVPAPIPIQKIAEAAGLCFVGPARLSVHPSHGPWLALRAVVTFDLPHVGVLDVLRSPCHQCPAPCAPAFERASSFTSNGEARDPAGQEGESLAPQGLSPLGARWLEARDACPVGRESRYSDQQLMYHYDKRSEVLFRES